VFIHKKILREHLHILGGTGTGKTSQGILPIAVQLLRQSEASPIIVLDLKGDRALFHTVREEAERNNQDFHFFSIESDKQSYRFNPFVGIRKFDGTVNERIQPILDALGLNHGEGYGRSFFSRIHRQRMLEAIRENPNINSFRELIAALNTVPGGKPSKRPVPVSSQKDELIAAVEGLCDYPQLYTTAEEEKTGNGIIQFDQVLERNQVVYFWLPCATQSISVREVGKLILYNLFFAALRRNDAGQTKQTYLIIDEFQRLIGENLALFLEQSRSYGISATLANQNIDQLNTPDVKLWPLVLSNVRASLHFGSADPKEIELLSDASGETTGTFLSVAHGGSKGSSEGRSESISTASSTSRSRATSNGLTLGESITISSSPFDPETTTTSVQESMSESMSKGTSKTTSNSQSTSTTESESVSKETTVTQYIRPRLRPHDISSIFNRGEFILWVRRGVPPLVDHDGKPIAVKGLFSMPEHLHKRRSAARWPTMSSSPGHVVKTSADYKASGLVTEKTMVDEFISSLKSPY